MVILKHISDLFSSVYCLLLTLNSQLLAKIELVEIELIETELL